MLLGFGGGFCTDTNTDYNRLPSPTEPPNNPPRYPTPVTETDPLINGDQNGVGEIGDIEGVGDSG